MKEETTNYYSPEIRGRAVRMVREHQGELECKSMLDKQKILS
jgi:hypothetical protein